MCWAFICKFEITSTKNKSGIIMLTIGISCLLFSMVAGFIINQNMWYLIIPLFYLLWSVKQTFKKTITLNIQMNFKIQGNYIEIIFNNTIRNKDGIFSEKYVFEISDIQKCAFLEKSHQLQITTNCQYFKVGNSTVEFGKTRTRNIKFILPENIEKDILEELNKKTNIEYLK